MLGFLFRIPSIPIQSMQNIINKKFLPCYFHLAFYHHHQNNHHQYHYTTTTTIAIGPLPPIRIIHRVLDFANIYIINYKPKLYSHIVLIVVQVLKAWDRVKDPEKYRLAEEAQKKRIEEAKAAAKAKGEDPDKPKKKSGAWGGLPGR